jgi:hypothetical protein
VNARRTFAPQEGGMLDPMSAERSGSSNTMMKTTPDTMLVESRMIVEAMQAVAELGTQKALTELEAREPELCAFISHNTTVIVGKLALAGAPSRVVQGAHEDLVTIILTCLGATKRGYDELWKDTMIGTRLAAIDATLSSREIEPPVEQTSEMNVAARPRRSAPRRASTKVARGMSRQRSKERGDK